MSFYPISDGERAHLLQQVVAAQTVGDAGAFIECASLVYGHIKSECLRIRSLAMLNRKETDDLEGAAINQFQSLSDRLARMIVSLIESDLKLGEHVSSIVFNRSIQPRLQPLR